MAGWGPGGWLFLFEPELRLDGDTLVPDLAGWRRERLPKVPDTQAITLAPDWVCEILSPSTEKLDRTRKLPAYARHGVGHAWLILMAEAFEQSMRSSGLVFGRDAWDKAPVVTQADALLNSTVSRFDTLWARSKSNS